MSFEKFLFLIWMRDLLVLYWVLDVKLKGIYMKELVVFVICLLLCDMMLLLFIMCGKRRGIFDLMKVRGENVIILIYIFNVFVKMLII